MELLHKLLFVAIVLAASAILTRWVPFHPRWRALVIALNIAISLRYMWWRATETLNWEGGVGTVLSLTVYLAEVYGLLVVLHHYVIATRRTDRRAEPPTKPDAPTVDVFIATYNEEPDILYRTIVGCLAMDYPAKRMYVLDDGNRPAIKQLAEQLGVGYFARGDNVGAKAGNLNHALARTGGDLVATFDADHVPVRTFLQETVGHFREPRVAQVQTAHHFYNPDPFQDRLRIREFIANEQDMFYHVVQPGRDVHNSSFYCGSGAVFRRAALAEIGGFPTKTITEDIHTTLLLHSSGWRSIYVNRDLSAGLAPESYSAYLTQRRRWARGTFQVMITQKGLFQRGLSAMQRLNYFATLWYWLYGFPRVVYLVAPLFFLLLGIRPLVLRDITDLLVYYVPHLAISIAGFQLVNYGMRRIFWSDVYESCISIQIALTALAFPFSARRKTKFAVTPKGRAAENTDRAVARPLWLLQLLVLVGLAVGVAHLALGTFDEGGVLINTLWTAYNAVVLAMGLLILRERPQRRLALRLPRRLPCALDIAGGPIEAETLDLSETGCSLRLTEVRSLPERFDITICGGDGRRGTLHGRLVRCDASRRGELSVGLEFVERTEAQRRQLVELMFCDPHAWSGPHALAMGAPEHIMRALRALAAALSRPRALRRHAPRLAGELPARVEANGRGVLDARTIDLSVGGAALRLSGAAVPALNERLRLTLHWNEIERTTVFGEVGSVRDDNGTRVVGMKFVDLDPQQRADLERHLRPAGAGLVELQ